MVLRVSSRKKKKKEGISCNAFPHLTVVAFSLADHVFEPGNQRFHAKDETEANSSALALVPWAPSQAAMATGGITGPEPQRQSLQETMEAEEAEATTSMEVEEVRQGGEGFQQLPQHCMISQFFPNASNPIMWSW